MTLAKEIISSPIKQALKLVKKSDANLTEQEVNSRIQRLKTLKESLFKSEKSAINEIDNELKFLESQSRFNLYGLYDLETFAWRDEEGNPLLIPIDIDADSIEFLRKRKVNYDSYYNSYTYSSTTKPELPKDLKKLFDDIFKKIKARERGASLKISFKGLVPAGVRDKINAARDVFERIFFVVHVRKEDKPEKETKGLTLCQVPESEVIVLGYDSKVYCLIDSFKVVQPLAYLEGVASLPTAEGKKVRWVLKTKSSKKNNSAGSEIVKITEKSKDYTL